MWFECGEVVKSEVRSGQLSFHKMVLSSCACIIGQISTALALPLSEG